MFYEIDIPEPKTNLKKTSALVILNPAESRRLLAKAVVGCSVVQHAWENGTIIIGRGITNAFVTEEFFDITIESKAAQTIGIVAGGILNGHLGPPPSTWHVIRKGKVVEDADSNVEILEFGPEDVVIKGANAMGVRLILRSKFGKMTVDEKCPEMLPAIAQHERSKCKNSLTAINGPSHA